ncbi:MAG: glycosyltransferase family 39 protein [Planctomycetes bacterium]|nr:glycosyltransferase family 39 protein [Planctomycetota bacterium]
MSLLAQEHRSTITTRTGTLRRDVPVNAVQATETKPASSTERFAVWATWALLALGVVVRLVRYLLRFPLWGDEYLLAENFLTRDAADFLRPLDNGQMAPLGYLWLTWGSTWLFGVNEWALRLPALVAGVASLFTMRQFAVRVLPPLAAAFAVGLLAVAYYPIRHAVEMKPYALDLCWSAVLLWLAVAWWQRPTERRWLWALALVAPVAIATSFPAVFVCGAVSLLLLAGLVQRRQWRDVLPMAAYAVAMLGTFSVIYKLSTAAQNDRVGDAMRVMWGYSFPPPLSEPLNWLEWMLSTHTGKMFAYPFGDHNFGSSLTTLLAIAGVVTSWRDRQRWLVGFCLATFGLGYVAAALHKYPYGNNERIVQYLGPWICLLAGTGLAALVERLPTLASSRARWIAAGVLAVCGTGIIVRDVSRPYSDWRDWQHRGFARWFWNQPAGAGPLVCASTDLGYELFPGVGHPIYKVSQRIHSPAHRTPTTGQGIKRLPVGGPVRVVVYRQSHDALRLDRWFAWMTAMSAHWQLSGYEEHRGALLEYETPSNLYGIYGIYHFTPRPATAAKTSDVR